MVSRTPATIAATAVGMLAVLTIAQASAGDYGPKSHHRIWGNHGGFDRHHNFSRRGHHHDSNNEPRVGIDIVGGSGLQSHLSGIGTYSGSIAAVHAPGAGIYFTAERRRSAGNSVIIAPKVRIIEVSEDGDNGCSYEAGVCVVRANR